MSEVDKAFVTLSANTKPMERGLDRARDALGRFVKRSDAAATSSRWGSGRGGIAAAINACATAALKFGSALGSAVGTAGRLASSLSGIGSGLGGLAGPALAVGGVGLGIGFLVKQASDLESQISQVRKTTGLQGGPLADLVEQVRYLTKTLPGVTREELMTIASEGGRLGIVDKGGEAGLLEYVKAVGAVKIALDDIPVEESSHGLAILLNNFKLGSDRTLGLASALNKLDDTSNATARDILDIAQRASLAAQGIGLTATQTLALAAALKESGVETEVAGTAISQILGRMTKNIDEFARLAGMSVDQFGELIRTDPLSALGALATAIQSLDQLAVSTRLGELGLEGEKVIQTMKALAANFGSVRDKVAMADSEFVTGASILAEVAIKAGITESMLKKLWEGVKDAAAAFGTYLLPAVQAAASHLERFFSFLETATQSDSLGAFAGRAVEAIDAIAAALEDPQSGIDLLRAAFDVLIAQIEVGAKRAASIFVDEFRGALGTVGNMLKVLGSGFAVAVPASGLVGGGLTPGAGTAGMTPEAALKEAEKKLSDLYAKTAEQGAKKRADKAADQADDLGAMGPNPTPLPAPDSAGAVARDRAERGAKSQAQDQFNEIVTSEINSAFRPGMLDAEMEAAREAIEKQLAWAKENGILNEDEFKNLSKALGEEMEKRKKLAEAGNRKAEEGTKLDEDLARLDEDRQGYLADLEERAAEQSINIGHAGIEDFGKQVQEAIGQRPNLAKEQRDYLKQMAEYEKKEEQLRLDNAKNLDKIAREMAAIETM